MGYNNESGTITRTASAALGQYLRVKDNGSGKLALAGVGASDYATELGTLSRATFADGDKVGVCTHCPGKVRKMVAAGVIAEGAAFYGAASGKISTTSSGTVRGVALEAAAADGDVIAVLEK